MTKKPAKVYEKGKCRHCGCKVFKTLTTCKSCRITALQQRVKGNPELNPYPASYKKAKNV